MVTVPALFKNSSMVVQAQQIKRDEQHPLLKVDTGGGDTTVLQQPSTIISPGWNVACASKRLWLDRLPELISACWMTLILLGITFLVFYALGMSAYRRQSLIIVKCNSSKPENNVFYHHIIPRGGYLPFMLYSDYLSSMAMEYPFLNFNVYFLIDDSLRDVIYGSKHSRLFKRWPLINDAYLATMNEKDKQELIIFQQRYSNINITTMPLSRYMAMTPLRRKWKMIPTYYLPFYARILAVWEYGGIGLDLTSLNNQFTNNRVPDSRINAILRQHNDGIEEKKYIDTLNTVDREEQTELIQLFHDFMKSIFSATYSLLDTPLSYSPVKAETNNNSVTVSRNYRNIHDNLNIIVHNSTEFKGKGIITKDLQNDTTVLNSNATDFFGIINPNNTKIVNTDPLPLLKITENITAVEGKITSKSENVLVDQRSITKVGTEIPHVIFISDFSISISDEEEPSYPYPELIQAHPLKKTNTSPYLLSISSDGGFVAATSRNHPFLRYLLSSSCKRINPRTAIEDAILFQCPGLLNNNVYCHNIYILDI